jgi:hypothetical protein
MIGALKGVTPHAARHNMVTFHLAEIDRIARDSKERELLRLQFVAQMSSASGESMLHVYDNRSPGRRILDVMQKVQEEMDCRERSYGDGGGSEAEPPVQTSAGENLIAQLIGDKSPSCAGWRESTTSTCATR